MRDLLEFAVQVAREAGESTLAYFGSDDLGLETKPNDSPVTRADREAEELLRNRIGDACPGDGIVGEEFGEQRGTSGRRWIIDPVDGTRSFVRGVPLYGTLVALEVDGDCAIGVAFLPALGETIYAARGLGAWWNRHGNVRPAHVSRTTDPAGALFCTTSVGGFVRSGHGALYERLRGRFGRDRGWSDCYGHVLVATGRADVMVDPRMAIWDCAALKPIVEEAGGRFTDLSGRATHDGGSAVSTNGALHSTVLDLAE